MGWFWADKEQEKSSVRGADKVSGCPVVHAAPREPAASGCPYPGVDKGIKKDESGSGGSYNPLNWMISSLSQERAAGQQRDLDTERVVSSIPRTDTGKPWEYPSPQQMYNAMVRKGYNGQREEAVPDMVDVHNWINEQAWQEIMAWESQAGNRQPSLTRFQGRPGELSPKARMYGYMSRLFPETFNGAPPFDRHDWYVQRQDRLVRYVIDYYAGPPEPNGDPVFYLDIRPALDSPGAVFARSRVLTRDIYSRILRGRPSRDEQ